MSASCVWRSERPASWWAHDRIIFELCERSAVRRHRSSICSSVSPKNRAICASVHLSRAVTVQTMVDPVFAQSGQMAHHISDRATRASRYRHLGVTFTHYDIDSGADRRIVFGVHVISIAADPNRRKRPITVTTTRRCGAGSGDYEAVSAAAARHRSMANWPKGSGAVWYRFPSRMPSAYSPNSWASPGRHRLATAQALTSSGGKGYPWSLRRLKMCIAPALALGPSDSSDALHTADRRKRLRWPQLDWSTSNR